MKKTSRSPRSKNPHAVALGRLGGEARAVALTDEERKQVAGAGGAARAAQLTDERRKEIAKKAAAARWGKKAAE